MPTMTTASDPIVWLLPAAEAFNRRKVQIRLLQLPCATEGRARVYLRRIPLAPEDLTDPLVYDMPVEGLDLWILGAVTTTPTREDKRLAALLCDLPIEVCYPVAGVMAPASYLELERRQRELRLPVGLNGRIRTHVACAGLDSAPQGR